MHSKYQKTGDIFDKTIEECAELIHIICKIKRFGIDNCHPETRVTNKDHLRLEIFDVRKRLEELYEKFYA